MSVQPLITFKAGKCDFTEHTSPPQGTVQADPTPGFLYFWQEDELMHFCWRKRSDPVDNPTIELFMIAGDARFLPYTGSEKTSSNRDFESPGDARICILKFLSSGERYLFYLQSYTQHPDEKPNWFSQRDLKQVKIIDELLAGKDINSIDVNEPITFSSSRRKDGDGNQDETMEDADGPETGGAGPGATGGDFRDEGEEAREGGADGARATSSGATDASAVVQNFLNSLKGGNLGGTSGQQQQQSLFTTLSDLLSPETTVPIVDHADISLVDSLLSHVPPAILTLSQEADDASSSTVEPDQETVKAAIEALSPQQKRDILLRVLRSPQLSQSLGSLTAALRDGGLPTVADALSVPVSNGGFVQGGTMPLGGGDAVEAFLNGVKKQVEEEDKDRDNMDTS